VDDPGVDRYPVFAATVMLALRVLRTFSLLQLGLEQFRDSRPPVAFVDVYYPGALREAAEGRLRGSPRLNW
jgi:multidrug efflux pump subunit AcrB